MYKLTTRLILLAVAAFAAGAGALEDPTRPPVVEKRAAVAPQTALPQLKSILVSPERRVALIDDQILAVGDSAGAIQLLRVDTDSVVVRTSRGERITLTLQSKRIHKELK